LRLTVSQSVSPCVKLILGLMTRYLLWFDSYGLVFVGRPLWREDGSVFYVCCWPLPVQSFSGPSPLGLATIFYCHLLGLPFRRLLLLAGSRWRYLPPLPHGFISRYKQISLYIASDRFPWETPSSHVDALLCCPATSCAVHREHSSYCCLFAGTCRCLAMCIWVKNIFVWALSFIFVYLFRHRLLLAKSCFIYRQLCLGFVLRFSSSITTVRCLNAYLLHLRSLRQAGAASPKLTFLSAVRYSNPQRSCLHLIVVVGFECSWDPESYAGGSVVTGMVTHAGQVKG
jgi:hypothetical protein